MPSRIEGQRACCVGEAPSCEEGLVEEEGCSGDCLCGGPANPFQISSSATCISKSTQIEEPTTNWTERPRLDRLSGYADLHAHLFAELASGGKVFAGKVYDEGSVALALDVENDKQLHGDPHSDLLSGGTKDGAINNWGPPYFSDWPTWSSATHQQMYYKWLERAWRGGLRLMVMLAVSNEALCLGSGGEDCRNSMLPPSRLDDLDKFDDRGPSAMR